MPYSRHASFPYVIISGYGTSRQQIYTSCQNCPHNAWTRNNSCAWRARSLGIAIFVANEIGARRKYLAIVKNFGTKHERVVWERRK